MKKINPKRLFFAILFSLLLAAGLFKVGSHFVVAQTPDEKLQELNDQIKQYEAELSRLKSQSNTLSNQIAQFDAQIRLTTLKIQETQEKILLLGGRIDQLEVSLEALTEAFSTRATEIYKMTRLGDSLILLITASDLNEAVSRYYYLHKIQEADRDLLVRLQEAQDVYEEEKVDQEDLHAQLEQQGQVLGAQKAAKANLLAVTKNDEKKYQDLLSQAVAQKNAFLRFVSGQGGASILENQTTHDDWGYYYNQRDSQWGNNSLGLSGLSVANYGCLITSVSMIASHHGINIKPSDIASNPDAFFGSTAFMLHQYEVNNVDVRVQVPSVSILDSELAAGRPVIAGLYNEYSPEHFIVILRKEGDQYIMHDPFLENGANRLLTDRYNVSDIKTLRLVSF
ncbi:C39 family peptidase [Patescibacteria group bacterium]|nr:C39 family peptidase [Patescibacteria group bacterium]MBU0776898.1 C39 family peptidase [Patescibacteria group bacterium]MBU0922571.1 C39 family peptidase [Patescibacteria group bacterium]MBU1845117.1 C39 family peptidase [Patescibacteria group bacterium]